MHHIFSRGQSGCLDVGRRVTFVALVERSPRFGLAGKGEGVSSPIWHFPLSKNHTKENASIGKQRIAQRKEGPKTSESAEWCADDATSYTP
jgi:hypothetical protein